MATYEQFTHKLLMLVNVYPKATGKTKPWQEHTSRKQQQQKKIEEKKKEKSSERKLHNI